MAGDPEKFCTASEAARRFGVDRRTIARWAASGKIRAAATAGGHLRISRSEMEDLLADRGFAQPPARKKTILIVDDDESVRKALARRLSRAGFAVETASDGFQAGVKAIEARPDLIILDLVMEGVGGFEVCRTIRANRTLKGTGILVLTGFDTAENRERALEEGADAFLSKKADFADILKCVRALAAG